MEEKANRPWYRLHRATWLTLLLLGAWLAWSQTRPRWSFTQTRPMTTGSMVHIHTAHGWPNHWFDRHAITARTLPPPMHTGALVTNTSYRWRPEPIAFGIAMSLLVLVAPAIVVERWRRSTTRRQFTVHSLFVLTLVVALLVIFLKHLPFSPFGNLKGYELLIVIFAMACVVYLGVCAVLYAIGRAIEHWRRDPAAVERATTD